MTEPKGPALTVNTAPVKYVFCDVVGFTRGRTVEAQTEIVEALNDMVRQVLQDEGVPAEKLIVLPTGDGLCVSLVSVDSPYDISLRIALGLLRNLKKHNDAQSDPQRKFEVRIGVNENTDNIITDFNGQRNVAGAGISMAQRVMALADGSQILVSDRVYETLRYREAYATCFKSHAGAAKHGQRFPVHQFVAADSEGLNREIPERFRVKAVTPRDEPLPDATALYIALAAYYHEEILELVRESPTAHDAAVLALYFFARDVIAEDGAPAYEKPTRRIPDTPSFYELVQYYHKQDYWLAIEASGGIATSHLEKFSYCFEGPPYDRAYAFPSRSGLEKLALEHPGLIKAIESGERRVLPKR